MSSLALTFTAAGNAAIANAQSNGLQVEITHVAIGTGAYVPDDTATGLNTEILRVPLIVGAPSGPYAVALRAVFENVPNNANISEIGYFTSNGTLLALWSRTEGPLFVGDGSLDMVLAMEVSWDHAPADSITVSVADLNAQQIVAFFQDQFPKIITPVLTAPAELDALILTPTFSLSAFESLYARTHAQSKVQISTDASFQTLLLDQTLGAVEEVTLPGGTLETVTSYVARVAYVNDAGDASPWGQFAFTTADIFIEAPTIMAPANNAVDVMATPTVNLSAYQVANAVDDTHTSTEIQIASNADFSTVVWDSGLLGAVVTANVPADTIIVSTNYYIRARFNGDVYGASGWSDPVMIATAAAFEYIEQPTIVAPVAPNNVDLSKTFTITASAISVVGTATNADQSRFIIYNTDGTTKHDSGWIAYSTAYNVPGAANLEGGTDYDVVAQHSDTNLGNSAASAKVRISIATFVAAVNEFDAGAGVSINCGGHAIDTNGNIYVPIHKTVNGDIASLVAKFSSDLTFVSNTDHQGISGNNVQVVASVCDANDNLFVLCANTSINGPTILKFDNSGALLTHKAFDTPTAGRWFWPNDLAISSTGTLYIVGYEDETNSSAKHPVCMAVSSTDLSKLSVKTYFPNSNGVNGAFSSVSLDSNDNLYVGGYYVFTTDAQDARHTIAKLNNSTLAIIASQTVKTSGSGVMYSGTQVLAIDANGNIFLGSSSTVDGLAKYRPVIYKFDSDLSLLKTARINMGDASTCIVQGIATDNLDNVFAWIDGTPSGETVATGVMMKFTNDLTAITGQIGFRHTSSAEGTSPKTHGVVMMNGSNPIIIMRVDSDADGVLQGGLASCPNDLAITPGALPSIPNLSWVSRSQTHDEDATLFMENTPQTVTDLSVTEATLTFNNSGASTVTSTRSEY